LFKNPLIFSESANFSTESANSDNSSIENILENDYHENYPQMTAAVWGMEKIGGFL